MNGTTVSVVLPAAGIGERCGIEPPKQFQEILGKPLLIYTIEEFARMTCVSRILILVQPSFCDMVTELLTRFQLNDNMDIKVLTGAHTRHRTIQKAVLPLKAVAEKDSVVVVHDVVRPICEEELLNEIVENASKCGACGVIRPLVSTILRVKADDDIMVMATSLDRTAYYASEMPQAFSIDTFTHMYSKASVDDLDCGTECLQLSIKHCNVKPRLVPGPDYLGKITYQRDITTYASIIKARNLRSAVLWQNEENKELLKTLNRTFGTIRKGSIELMGDNISLFPEVQQVFQSYSTLVFICNSQMILSKVTDNLFIIFDSNTSWFGAVIVCLCTFQSHNLCIPFCGCSNVSCEFFKCRKLVQNAKQSGTVVGFYRGANFDHFVLNDFILHRSLHLSGAIFTL